MKRILVPTNFAQGLDKVLAAAQEVAAPQSTLLLLHVIETIQDTPFDELKDFYAKLEESAKGKLQETAEQLQSSDLEVKTEVRYGERVKEILACADDFNAEMIILQSHRIDPDKPGESIATISYKVAVFCRCPVLLLK